jgi:putative DNA primase/helicase
MMGAAKQYDGLDHATISAALSHIEAFDRDVWLRMAMAVKSELGDAGFDVWDQWSATSDNYDAKAARSVWKSVKIGGGVTIATLIREAVANGFRFDDSAPRIDPAERERRKAAQQAVEAHQRELAKIAAETAQSIWDEAKPVSGDNHPYLRQKLVKSHGLRSGRWPLRNKEGEVYGYAENVLLIPMKNQKGKITSLQGIFDQLPKGYESNKTYLRDATKRGSFHLIGKTSVGTLAICEGYATGATIFEATGWAVAICFDRSNLETVARELRPALPGVQIVICADNDQFTDGNPGVRDATAAGAAIHTRVVVPQFQNLKGKPTDFNDLASLEGVEEVKRQLGIVPGEAANDNQPSHYFQPLGYDRETFFVFQFEKKQLVELTPASMTELGFINLAPLQFWSMEFPTDKGAFDRRAAADWLMRECIKRGIYDPSRIRGRGAWMDDGRVVYHFGGRLWVDGVMSDVTTIKSRYVYELARSLNEPASVSLSDDDGRRLVEIAKQFRWTKPASAALLCGWVALAPICGALRWRPHIWITGGAGCGKTTVLNDFVHRLMGGMDIFAQGNSTEAGIRQRLKCDALPVLFDESEQNNDREASRVQNVLSLIRQASSESAATTLKGTAGGEAMQFIVRSMFCLSSIQVGMKHQADFERLAVLALRPKHEDSNAADGWKHLSEQLYWISRDETLPARLFRRSLDLLPITQQNVRIFSEAAARKFGSQRDGDQYGTLLAGCWSLMSSREATPEQAERMIDGFDWAEYRENAESDESTKAMTALLECEMPVVGGRRASVFEVVKIAAGDYGGTLDFTARDADAVLQRFGMKVVGDDLLLSNNSTALTNLMRETPFAADIRGQLLRVKGVRRYEKAARFNGVVSKSIAVPVSIFSD